MNPTDALEQDWRLYYNGAWMLHKLFGPVQVSVKGQTLYAYTYPDDERESEPVRCKADELECWWPRSGSYNTTNGAVYIARMTSRSMRKSAHPSEHYMVKWGRGGHYGMSSLMVQLRQGPKFIKPDFALEVLDRQLSASVALTHDLIIQRDNGDNIVIFKGIRAGKLLNGEFIAEFPTSPVARRVAQRLMEENVL